MPETIGRVEIAVDFDGRSLPAQARKIAGQAGADSGKEFSKGFNKESEEAFKELGPRLRKQMQENGTLSGRSFSDAMRSQIRSDASRLQGDVASIFKNNDALRGYVLEVGDVGKASEDLQGKLEELRREGLVTGTEFGKLKKQLRGTVAELLPAQNEAHRTADEMSKLKGQLELMGKLRVKSFAVIADDLKELGNATAIRKLDDQLDSATRVAQRLNVQIADFKNFEGLNKILGDPAEFRKLADQLGSVGNAFDAVDDRIKNLHADVPRLRTQLEDLSGTVYKMRGAYGEAETRMRKLENQSTGLLDSFRRNRSETSKLTRTFDVMVPVAGKLGDAFKRLTTRSGQTPYVFKQIAAYTALFTALAPAIAVLGSAAGSGLAALTTGVGALGAGLAVTITGFNGMFGSLDDVAAAARPAARAMQKFSDPLSEIHDTVQAGLFEGLGDEIDDLRTKLLPKLSKGLSSTATTVNGIFDDMLGRLTSTSGLGRLDRIFGGLQPILRDLGTAALNLGGAFTSIFEAALPSGQNFSGWLSTITGQFNAWLADPSGGQAKLTTFFDHLNEIMPSVGTLIGSAGKAVSSLVTDKAVDNMTAFLDSMSTAIPNIVGPLGGLIDTLNPLGLASSALNGIGSWFADHAPDLAAFGAAANDFVTKGGATLGTIIGKVGDALAKVAPDVLKSLGDGIAAFNDPQTQEAIDSALPALAKTLKAGGKALGDLLKAANSSGAIGAAIDVVGTAASVATPLITALDAALVLLTGDWKKAAKISSSKAIDLVPDKSLGGKGGLSDTLDKQIKGGGISGSGATLERMILGAFNQDEAAKLGKQLGEQFGGAFGEGVGGSKKKVNPAGAGLFRGLLDLFDSGGDQAKSKGKNVGDNVGKGVDSSKGTVKVAGVGLLGSLVQGVTDADPNSKLGGAFQTAAEGIPAFFQNVPSGIASIFGGLTGVGQGGADNTSNPFSGITGTIGSLVGGTPGVIGGIMGLVTGKGGADNTSNPFSGVGGAIRQFVAGTPGVISGIMGAVSGQKGATNTSNPFSGVASKIRGFVNGVPGAVSGALASVTGSPAAQRIIGAFQGVPAAVRRALAGLGSIVSNALAGAKSVLDAGLGALNPNKHATGTVTTGPEFALIGEAGPEAVVPLNRPLSQVDPSVRALSAIAQGKALAPSSGGGTSRSLVIEEGAIQTMIPNADPELAASALLDRIIAEFSG